MTDRPRIFSGAMVRALLEGRKTMTRRILKVPDTHLQFIGIYAPGLSAVFAPNCMVRDQDISIRLPSIGDRLYVRENYSGHYSYNEMSPSGWPVDGPLWYWADGNPEDGDWTKPRPSIHMPRWASRITLTVEAVKVERLQSISDADVRAEGIPEAAIDKWRQWLDPRDCAGSAFKELWDSLNAKRAPWDSNPWVVAVTFKVHKCNIDRMAA